MKAPQSITAKAVRKEGGSITKVRLQNRVKKASGVVRQDGLTIKLAKPVKVK